MSESESKKCGKCFNGNLIAPILVGAAAGGLGYVLSSFAQNLVNTPSPLDSPEAARLVNDLVSKTTLSSTTNPDAVLAINEDFSSRANGDQTPQQGSERINDELDTGVPVTQAAKAKLTQVQSFLNQRYRERV